VCLFFFLFFSCASVLPRKRHSSRSKADPSAVEQVDQHGLDARPGAWYYASVLVHFMCAVSGAAVVGGVVVVVVGMVVVMVVVVANERCFVLSTAQLFCAGVAVCPSGLPTGRTLAAARDPGFPRGPEVVALRLQQPFGACNPRARMFDRERR
jgi:hypothetical protein